jgi:symplekin
MIYPFGNFQSMFCEIYKNVYSDVADVLQDPRRLDPRRTVSPAATNSIQVKVETSSVHQTDNFLNAPCPVSGRVENHPDHSGDRPHTEDEQYKSSQPNQKVLEDKFEPLDVVTGLEPVEAPVDPMSHSSDIDVEMVHPLSSEVTSNDEADNADMEVDPFLPLPAVSTPEDTNHDLPVIPSHVELSNEEKISLNKLVITKIINYYKKNSLDARFSLLAQLVAQVSFNLLILVYL